MSVDVCTWLYAHPLRKMQIFSCFVDTTVVFVSAIFGSFSSLTVWYYCSSVGVTLKFNSSVLLACVMRNKNYHLGGSREYIL